MRTYLFDDVGSIWHFALGFLLGAFAPFWFLFIATVVFLVYEVQEQEDPVSTIGDVVEFLSGGFLGLAYRVLV